jgi:hypothetical protein
MVLYAYIERPLAELFEPFTAENLPATYAAKYADEQDENTRQARLRLYGKIHSLSREQLDAYNQLDDSEDRSVYLETQRSKYRLHKRVTDYALRRGRNPAAEMSSMGVDTGRPPLNVSHQLNETAANGPGGSDETIYLDPNNIKDATKALLPAEMLEELLFYKRKDRGPLPEDCAHYDPEKHKRGVVFWFDQLAIAVRQYGGDLVGRKNRLWRYLKNNQGCQTMCIDVHREHTNDVNTTYIDVMALYRDKLNNEGYKASQKTAYANRRQRPEECPLA